MYILNGYAAQVLYYDSHKWGGIKSSIIHMLTPSCLQIGSMPLMRLVD